MADLRDQDREIITRLGRLETGLAKVHAQLADHSLRISRIERRLEQTGSLVSGNGELSSTEDDGVRVECQAFERDGGAGIVTILRHFGEYPRL
jgi:hypothetical protein